MRVDVNRELEVSGDTLKLEIPSPKGRVKPLFSDLQMAFRTQD